MLTVSGLLRGFMVEEKTGRMSAPCTFLLISLFFAFPDIYFIFGVLGLIGCISYLMLEKYRIQALYFLLVVALFILLFVFIVTGIKRVEVIYPNHPAEALASALFLFAVFVGVLITSGVFMFAILWEGKDPFLKQESTP